MVAIAVTPETNTIGVIGAIVVALAIVGAAVAVAVPSRQLQFSWLSGEYSWPGKTHTR